MVSFCWYEWVLAGMGLLVIVGFLLLIVCAIIRRRRSRRQQVSDPLIEALNEDVGVLLRGQEERRGRMRRLVTAIKTFPALARKHKYWSFFTLFWVLILIISILYEYGIVR